MVSAEQLATIATSLVNAMKNVFIQKSNIKSNSWSETTSDNRVPSEKLVKDSLDTKADSSDVPTAISDLTDDSDFIDSTELATELSDVVRTSNTSGLIKNDGTIDTSTYLTSHQSLTNYVQKSETTGLIKNDGTIDTSTYLTSHQSLDDYVQKSETAGLIKNDGTIDTNTYLTQHQDISGKANSADLATVATSGDYTDLSNTPNLATVATSGSYSDLSNKPDLSVYLTEHQNISGKEDKTNKVTSWSSTTTNDHYPSEALVKDSLDAKADATDIPTALSDLTDDVGYLTEHQSLSDIGGEVTVEKQQTAETGYAATYVIKQDGTQVGSKINIPKDFLVKDAGMSTVSTANTPVSGYEVGDKYLWFKVNTVDADETDTYIYILVSDLIDTYTADNTTLELSGSQFKVKNGGIGTTQLSTGVNTSLGYADAWNSSAAKNITSTDISNWNAKGSSNLTTADVDSEIESYLSAIITELNGQ